MCLGRLSVHLGRYHRNPHLIIYATIRPRIVPLVALIPISGAALTPGRAHLNVQRATMMRT